MISGNDLKELIDLRNDLSVMVTRIHGTVYSALVTTTPHTPPQAICQPGTDEVLKFDSLDEAAAFLSQVGIQRFQVTR